MNELRAFLAWGAKQPPGPDSFPSGLISYWIHQYEIREDNPDREQALTYWQGSYR